MSCRTARHAPAGRRPRLSPALVDAILGKGPRLRLAETTQRRLLDLARHWYETGGAGELRRRTGAPGPVTWRLIEDAKYTDVEEVSLGEFTVRAGHSAVLTSLQWAFASWSRWQSW